MPHSEASVCRIIGRLAPPQKRDVERDGEDIRGGR